MSNKKQSSIEWFIEENYKLHNKFEYQEVKVTEYSLAYIELVKKAKAMHKEEIEQSYMSGAYDKATIFEEAQTYYTKTFGGDNE